MTSFNSFSFLLQFPAIVTNHNIRVVIKKMDHVCPLMINSNLLTIANGMKEKNLQDGGAIEGELVCWKNISV